MNKSATIEKGDRIGQLVLNKVEQIEWNSVLVLSDTDRGTGGFGSTGK
jgi:dUTP pyrophosphatase